MRLLLNGIARTSEVLAAVCFAGFLFAILAQVAYRYLGISLVFSEELARILNVYVVFIGLVLVTRTDGHIRIDLLERACEGAAFIQPIIRTLHLLAAFIFLVLLAVGSWQLVESSWTHRIATISWITHGHIYLAPFIGSSASAVVVFVRLFDLRGRLNLLRLE